MKPTPIFAATAFLQFFSPTGEGFQLEICAGDEAGKLLGGAPYPIATIFADEQEECWFEFYTPSGTVRLPLTEVERAIEAAKPAVHGEAWYDHRPDEV